MTEEQKARHDSDYEELVELYLAMLYAIDEDQREEALYELSERRAEQAINHVLKGMGVDYDEAIRLLRNADDDNLTQSDKDKRDRIIAALENLVSFAVCEEYQLYDEARPKLGQGRIDFDTDDYEELLALCEKYNDRYAAVENADIEWAGVMAALWIRLSARDYLVYWTQNDAKVRPSHMALQGYAAPRDEFPSWMIPPIEYNCRCYLEPLEVGSVVGQMGRVKGLAKDIRKPEKMDDVFSESLARCGRIFGPSHSYFNVKEADAEMLKSFVKRIKEKYYGKAEV